MRVLILAYDPAIVDPKIMIQLQSYLERDFGCQMYVIPHQASEGCFPVYEVTFIDSNLNAPTQIGGPKNFLINAP